MAEKMQTEDYESLDHRGTNFSSHTTGLSHSIGIACITVSHLQVAQMQPRSSPTRSSFAPGHLKKKASIVFRCIRGRGCRSCFSKWGVVAAELHAGVEQTVVETCQHAAFFGD
ncbi:hypothetical protein EJ02DRAFT_264008 [Clathrospora elynae]|uniref:Uncharacterized protein n=1 Tax=Clathrospora elynae TaxID=706981 RepID=A0A6A5SKY1_9PLEO|nr:hypothetical protein EJ02DRAFT_264008 [Clathrospora elynae]